MKKILILVVAVLAFVGCSSLSGNPSESDAKKIVLSNNNNDIGNQEKEGIIKILSFRKTDGLASIQNGVKCYTLSYELKVEVLKDIGGFSAFGLGGPGQCKAGGVYSCTGNVIFVKTEQGWQGNEQDGSWSSTKIE